MGFRNRTGIKIRFIKDVELKQMAILRAREQGKVELDENFMRALYVDFMSDPVNQFSRDSLMRFRSAFSCPQALVLKWRTDKDVQSEIRNTVRQRFGGGERIKELYDLLWEQCSTGRVSAIKLAMEVTGEYTPKMQHIDRPKSLEEMLDQMDKKVDKDDSEAKVLN